MSRINIDFTPIGAISGLAQRAGEGEAFNRRFQQEQQLVQQALDRQRSERQAQRAQQQLQQQAAELNMRERSQQIQNALAQQKAQLAERRQGLREQQFEAEQRPERPDPNEMLLQRQRQLQLQQDLREQAARRQAAQQAEEAGDTERAAAIRAGVGGSRAFVPEQPDPSSDVQGLIALQNSLRQQLNAGGASQEEANTLQRQIDALSQQITARAPDVLRQFSGEDQRAGGARQTDQARQSQQQFQPGDSVLVGNNIVTLQALDPNDPPNQNDVGRVFATAKGPAVFTGRGTFRPVDAQPAR